MLKKGPEIKLPKLKVPDPLLDLFYDLRERHLLPLVAVLVVAIVAVPIALSQTSQPGSTSPAAVVAAAPLAASRSHSGELVVAKTAPNLHSYHRRFRYLRPKEPFYQPYANPVSTSGGSSTSAGGEGASSSGASGSSPESPTAPTTSPQTTTTSTQVTHHLIFFSYAIDVRVVTGGSKSGKASTSKTESQVRRNLPELSVLPSHNNPAVIFMGVTEGGKKALFLLSSNATSFGEGRCVLGSQTCQLLALEPGQPETFTYGPQSRTFKIELLKVHLVVSKKQHLAPIDGHIHGH